MDSDSNVSRRIPPAEEAGLLAQARPFEVDERFETYRPPDPPSVEGSCNRCGYRGVVYPGRYGGQRCAVCFGLQHGWMPSR